MVEIKMLTEFNKMREISEKFKQIAIMTTSEKENLIKEIQKFNEEIKNKERVIDEINKIYIVKDEKGRYTGLYFKIMIEWIIMYKVIDNIKDSSNFQELRKNKIQLKEIKSELEILYKEAIDIARKTGKKEIAKKMQIGASNLERFYKYGTIISELIELKMNNPLINKVLLQNKDVFYSIITEQKNYIIKKSIDEAIKELKMQINEKEKAEIEKVIVLLSQLKKII
ncbi:MAG: hypothetical protein NZ903_02035 [Candidatus Micrarchaeota archaeon]|nr:hypothetical protein [Candidatus Micrarchaeota archaeon]